MIDLMTLEQRAAEIGEAIGADWNEGWREKEVSDLAMKHFNAIIEECALVIENDKWLTVRHDLVAKIRAKKDEL